MDSASDDPGREETRPPKATGHVPEPGSIEEGAGKREDGEAAFEEGPFRTGEDDADGRMPTGGEASRSEGVESGEP